MILMKLNTLWDWKWHYNVIIAGNKSDMGSMREVEFVEAEAMCEYLPEVLYVMETSAKDNAGIEEAFMCLATELKVGG